MKSSSKSLLVFTVAFGLILLGLYRLQDGKSAHDKTQIPGDSSIVSTPADLGRDTISHVSPDPASQIAGRHLSSLPSATKHVRHFETASVSGHSTRPISEGNNKTFASVAPSRTGMNVDADKFAQQMRLRKRLSDKIVQQNLDRMTFQLKVAQAAADKIEQLLSEKR